MSHHSFSTQQLYYLQQIGITPWVHKNTSPNKETLKLILLTSADLTPKAQIFLNHILNYLNIEQHNVTCITDPKDLPRQIKAKKLGDIDHCSINSTTPTRAASMYPNDKQHNSALIVLTFGLNPEELNHLNHSHSITEGNPLDQVLKNAPLKKRLFLQLSKLKNFYG